MRWHKAIFRLVLLSASAWIGWMMRNLAKFRSLSKKKSLLDILLPYWTGVGVECFSDKDELIRFAEGFLKERIESLEKDVSLCLTGHSAPFPALLYCFATIDLLGALYCGSATRNAPTKKQSVSYMKRFMSYSGAASTLLIDIFRHKIVHTAQPRTVVKNRDRYISWGFWHNDRLHHLKIVKLQDPEHHKIGSRLSVTITHRFEISIAHLVRDIRKSVFSDGGILDSLREDNDLQAKFDKAVSEIYSPA